MRAAFVFTAGFALGVAAGWAAAVVLRPADVPAPETPSVAPASLHTADGPRRIERRREAPPARDLVPAPTPEDRAQILESGDADAILRAMRPRPALSDAEAAASAARLVQARDAGQADVFLAVLETLGKSKNSRADAKIVEVLGDPRYPIASLKTGIFFDFERWLRDGEATRGTGAAARRRIDANAAEGDVRRELDALMRIVARHGDADDLAWLVTATSSHETGVAAVGALTSVARAETAPIVATLLAAGELRGADLVAYARNNPTPAWELLKPRVLALNDVDPPASFDLRSLLQAYATAAPESALPDVRGGLLGLRKPEHRAAAVYAVQALADGKIDVASFQPIIDAPIEWLAQPGDIDGKRGYACMYAIEYNRVAWSLRSAEALESAAPRAGALGDGFRRVAREIRTELAGPWRAK